MRITLSLASIAVIFISMNCVSSVPVICHPDSVRPECQTLKKRLCPHELHPICVSWLLYDASLLIH